MSVKEYMDMLQIENSKLNKENSQLKEDIKGFEQERQTLYNTIHDLQKANKQLNRKRKKAIEYIESKNNGICIVNGEEKGAYTFLLDFNKSREFIWYLLEILKGDK